MNKYQQELIKEHSELIIKLDALYNYIYNGEKSKSGHSIEEDNKVEFANKCIQLKGMRMYAEALNARLANTGIIFTEDGEYLTKVAQVEDVENEERNISDNN